MQNKIFITCAVTGNLTTPEQTPHLPITPRQIATSALEAADAGAAIAHIHVRDPETGKPSTSLDIYREVVDRIRDKNPALILNITTGPGGRFVPSEADPKVFGPGTTLIRPELRVEHIAMLKPEICTLDLNTMNSGAQVVINTPGNVRKMARIIRDSGVRPEIELFDSGDIALLQDLVKDGTIDPAPLCSIVMGVPYGFQPSPETAIYARNLLPAGATWTAFGIGRWSFPMAAQSLVAGGHVRVGMEDAVYLSRGTLAPSNAALVEKARGIVEAIGTQVMTAQEARAALRLPSA
ncbi:3-keto-5-aminohexanoate cleavage protein [Bosea sp. NPDC055332]